MVLRQFACRHARGAGAPRRGGAPQAPPARQRQRRRVQLARAGAQAGAAHLPEAAVGNRRAARDGAAVAEGANAQLHAEQTHDAAMAALTVKCSRLQQAFHTLSKVAVEQLDALRDEVTTLARGLEDVRAKAVMKTGLERVADNPFERVADPAKFSTLQAQQTGTEREVEMLKEALKMQQRTINKLTKQVEALRDEDGIEEGTASPSRSLVSRSAAPSIAGTDSPSSVRSSVRSSAAASTKASLRSLSMPKAPAPPRCRLRKRRRGAPHQRRRPREQALVGPHRRPPSARRRRRARTSASRSARGAARRRAHHDRRRWSGLAEDLVAAGAAVRKLRINR